jgi:hypothetical protein
MVLACLTFAQLSQFISLVFLGERFDDLVQMPLHDFVELVESEVDPMVG